MINRLTDADRDLIAECKAERIRLLGEKDQTKQRVKEITAQIRQLSDLSLARKFHCSETTVRIIPVAGS